MAPADFRNVGLGSFLDRPTSIAEAVEIYAEMFNLLEDYAPAWYTEELHNRAVTGLEIFRRLREAPAEATRRLGGDGAS